jgi:hypothetical protein
MRDWLTRRRLDVPEVHRLLYAQAAMLEDWAETEPHSPERAALWTNLHRAGDDLGDLVYGGPTLWMRWRYWIRPFDSLADGRRWRWQRRYPCQYGDGLPAVLDAWQREAP